MSSLDAFLPPERQVFHTGAVSPSSSANDILRALKRLYRPPKSFLQWRTPLDLLIATILSARCTDVQVNRITPALFARCRTADDYLHLPRNELERLIHSCGTFRSKAKYIHLLCKKLKMEHGGKVPHTMEALTSLSGVGRKTACIVLYAAFGKNEGIAVDTHVFRVARRLGLSKGRTPERVERDLMKLFPRKEWGRINALFISHGRAVCTGQRRKCEQCVFKRECPSSLVSGKRDWAK
ncbi:MAG TPA: endonuclease III [Candidatus Peribacter riflensis]|nr:endonuclease III [Candidatus Peribacter riflensis]HBU10003.1 endonuclease III [Candidatus Peribacter riflensis]